MMPLPNDAIRRLRQAVRAAVPARADFALIYLLHRNVLQCAALAHHTRTGERVLRTLLKVYRITRDDPDSTVAQVVRLRRPSVRAKIRPEHPAIQARAGKTPEILHLHQQLGVRSAIVVPMEGRTGMLGAMVLSYCNSRRQYTRADLAMAERITRAAALIVETARTERAPVQSVAPGVTRKRTRLVRTPGAIAPVPRLRAR